MKLSHRFREALLLTLWYYRAVVDTLKQTGGNPLVDELDRTVTEIERLSS